ncbi:phosphate ABC transporter permease PstA [Thermodesulfovibrio hydrogeniphilus]
MKRLSSRTDIIFPIIGFLGLFLVISFMITLVLDIFLDGLSKLKDPSFYASYPSRFPDKSGILAAWVGTLLVMGGAIFWSLLIGIPAGIYLEEYASRKGIIGKIETIIELNINNLAAVPAIIYGLLALGIFVYRFNFGESILTAGLTLSLLMLPVIVVNTREAIRRIPRDIREGAYAVGATKWDTIRDHILPYSLGGILTGLIIAASRAIGETAPLITIGALTFIAFLPPSPFTSNFPFISGEKLWEVLLSPFTVLPIQIFNWVSRPQADFQINAAAAGFVLLVLTVLMNAIAYYFRQKVRRKYIW